MTVCRTIERQRARIAMDERELNAARKRLRAFCKKEGVE